MKIGFFGGSFSPPTTAHINLAKKVLKECNLDKVVFVPIGDFYLKKDLLPFKDRINMLKIVCNKNKNLEVSSIEENIKEKICAIDAFRIIEKEYPNDDAFFIMGADNFARITEWKEYKLLIEDYKYIVIDREDIDLEKYIIENKHLLKNKDKITIVKNEEHKKSSSSKFRQNLKDKNENFKTLVSEEVYNYIEENKLFS